MSDLPTIVLVDDEPAARKLTSAFLKGRYKVIGEAANGYEGVQLVEDLRPQVLLMDLEMPVMGGLEATGKILSAHPETKIVIASGRSDIKSLKQAMAAGAREYLIKPYDKTELLECLDRIVAEAEAREAAMEAAQQRDERVPGAGTWTFLGAGTGDGRTTLLLGLGSELVSLGHSVCIVDLDLLFGDVAFYLGMDVRPPTLLDLFGTERYLERSVIDKHIKRHESGLHMLTGSSNPAGLLDLDYTRVAPLTESLETFYDYVLVDTPFGLSESLIGVLDQSRFLFPVASMEPSQLKNLKIIHAILGKLGYSPTKLRPLLTGSRVESARQWIERVRIDVARVFPSDAASANEAIRRGQPVTRVAPQGPLGLSIREFLAPLLRIPRPQQSDVADKSILERLLG